MDRVFWCDQCGTKMKILPEMLGKAGKCVRCGKAFVVTEANTVPADKAPRHHKRAVERPPKEETAAVRPPSTETPWATDSGSDLSDAPGMEELLAEEGLAAGPDDTGEGPRPAPPPPPPLPPPRGTFVQKQFGVDALFGAANIALDWRKIVMVVILNLLEAVGLGALLVITLTIPEVFVGLAVLWVVGFLGILVGGMSRLVHVELTEHRRPSPMEGWGFIARRFIELFLVLAGIVLGTVLVGAIVNGIVYAIALYVPGLGRVIGALLVGPLFLFNLFLAFVLYNAILVPCAMGVENCGAVDALNRVLRLVRRRPGQIIAYRILAFWLFLPLVIVLAAYACIALLVTLAASTGVSQDLAPDIFSFGVRLSGFFAGIVLTCCSAFVWVLGISFLTVVYESVREEP